MRSLWALTAVFFLIAFSFAQQTDQPKSQSQKKPPATQPGDKPAENPAIKPEAPSEQRPPAREAASDKDKEKDKEERYDMTEVPPVVTHHQITVAGKLLKYTATAGRLPIKRGDGKI